MEQTTLYFKDGKSDKVYRAAIEPKGDGYVVNFSYGRRGGNMTIGTKTKSPVSLDDAKAIYDKLIDEKTAKGYTSEERGTPTKPKRVTWKHKVRNVSHNQFYIAPKERPETGYAYCSVEESQQGFLSYPQYAIIYCDDVWTVNLEADMADTAPSIRNTVQAACLPIEVSDDDGLYIQTCDYDGHEHKINVPRGKYDMLVRIYATEDDSDDEYDDDMDGPCCRASLTFLPRGTVGPRCFKQGYGMVRPSSMVIHTSDEETQEFPI